MNEVGALAVAIAGPMIAGAGVARGLGLFAPRHGRLERAALAFALGSLQVTTLLFWANLVGIALGPGLAWTVLAPGLLGWLRRAPQPAAPPTRPPSARRRLWLTALLALFLALGIGRAAAVCFAEPITCGDAFLVWQFKGRAFHADGAIRPVLQSEIDYANRDYPLHVPLESTYAYLLAGVADDLPAKALGFAHYLAILALAAAAFRRRLGAHGGLFLTAMLAALPPLAIHTGEALADVPFALYLLGAALALDAYRRAGEPGSLGLAAILLYGCMWTKNEGAAVTLVALSVAAVLVARRHRRRDLARLIPLLLIVPWFVFRVSLDTPSDHVAGALAHGSVDALARIPEILWRTAGHAFRPGWLGLWAALLLLIGIRPAAVRRVWPLLTIVLGTLAAYGAVLAITGGDFVWLIQTAFGRLLLHTAPVAAVVVADLWAVSMPLNGSDPPA